jgi:hypothetical protein
VHAACVLMPAVQHSLSGAEAQSRLAMQSLPYNVRSRGSLRQAVRLLSVLQASPACWWLC